MKRYVILAVSRTEIGASIGAFGSGIATYHGYPVTYPKIKKYTNKKTAMTRARFLKHHRTDVHAYVESVEIPEDGKEKEINPRRAHSRQLSFQNLDRH